MNLIKEIHKNKLNNVFPQFTPKNKFRTFIPSQEIALQPFNRASQCKKFIGALTFENPQTTVTIRSTYNIIFILETWVIFNF